MCEATGIRVRTSKSEAMVICQKFVDCSPQVGNESLSQENEFKYMGILESGHEFWVVTETVRLWMQAAEMNFLWAQA